MRPDLATAARAVLLAVVGAAALFAVVKAGEMAEARVGERLASEARHRSEIYAQSLEGAIERFGYLPAAAALDLNVRRLLDQPDDAALAATVNAYLETLNRAAGTPVLYLMDPSGMTIAASNWDTRETYVGVDFSYRPYFTEAMAGQTGRFYAIGTLTGVPGYFISAPVVIDGKIRGVVVTKVNLDPLEAVWQEAADRVLVTDRHGIVFLASDPRFKFHATRPIDAATAQEMEKTRQYGRPAYPQLNLGTVETVGGVPLIAASDVAPHGRVIADDKALVPYGWHLLLFADAAALELAGRTARVGMTLGFGVLGLLGLYWWQHLKRARESLAARTALEAAQRELEAKVEARTADLTAANGQLAGEIEERRRAEAELRAAQDELVQAAKMATLGQMAAGITHELNQPLTALRGLADNAGKLLEQGREDEAQANLGRITTMVDRLGKITGQLRAFARKSSSQTLPVDVSAAVAESLAILAPRIRVAGIGVATDLDPAAATVRFEPIRLSQVVVNLVGNALDAVKGRPGAWVGLSTRRDGARIILSVEDNGPGLPEATLARIFDPFFTTKPAGEGLGLGLPISLAIAREFGATLAARARVGGGLAFDLIMEAESVDAAPPVPERLRHVC
ncbi:sensor histidine kinase [Xanthobacter oligotrophicus]|uniref:sensor histidine kinase n=1 Tax=Xanthobacter oligotrophicus TaxID=2607286 RepID=UPI0011F12D5F|nr:ATP-binding protein [Xanthobacter oligotrophicus]MCG5234111.1 ATP-binding protein [Xanthobacter oligotrophicus]